MHPNLPYITMTNTSNVGSQSNNGTLTKSGEVTTKCFRFEWVSNWRVDVTHKKKYRYCYLFSIIISIVCMNELSIVYGWNKNVLKRWILKVHRTWFDSWLQPETMPQQISSLINKFQKMSHVEYFHRFSVKMHVMNYFFHFQYVAFYYSHSAGKQDKSIVWVSKVPMPVDKKCRFLLGSIGFENILTEYRYRSNVLK